MKNKFDLYLENILKDSVTNYSYYKGINKKDDPKWSGWKLILYYNQNKYNMSQEEIKVIEKKLDILVENFYYLRFINDKFNNESL